MSKPFRRVVNGVALLDRAIEARNASRLRHEKQQRVAQLEKIIGDRLVQEMQRGSCMGCLDLLPDGHRDEGWDRCFECYRSRAGAGEEYKYFCQICHEADELDSNLMNELRDKLVAKEFRAQHADYGFDPTLSFACAQRPVNMKRVRKFAAFM